MELWTPQLRESVRIKIDDKNRDDPYSLNLEYSSANEKAINEPSEKEYLNAVLQKVITTTAIARESRRFLLVIMIELAIIIYALLK